MRLWLLAMIASLPVPAAAAPDGRAWPDVPVPPDAKGELVADYMLYNGIPMRASRFDVGTGQAAVIDFYRSRWHPMAVNELRGKKVLGHAQGDYYITVELTGQGNRTRGQIGVMRLPHSAPAAPLGRGVPLPQGTRVYEDIRYPDDPRRTRTLNMVNRLSPLQNQAHFRQAYRARGFRAVTPPGSCAAASARCMGLFERKGERVVVTTARQGPVTSVLAILTSD